MKISIITILQVILSIGIGGWVAYRIKDAMIAIILKMMPMRYKMSENSVNLHGRISTITAFLIIVSISSGVFWGTSQLKPMIVSSSKVTSKRSPKPIAKAEVSKPIEQSIITPIPSEEETVPARSLQPYDDIIERPTPPKKAFTNIISNEGFFIQVYALSKMEKAIQQCNKEIKKRKVNCVIGVIENHNVPYRILLGPFYSRHDAQSYQHKMQLKSMIRPSESMDYFIHQ